MICNVIENAILNISGYPFFLQIPNLEVWFQRPKDIVRKLQSGDLDLGIVGFDIVSEYGKVTFWAILLNIFALFVYAFSLRCFS